MLRGELLLLSEQQTGISSLEAASKSIGPRRIFFEVPRCTFAVPLRYTGSIRCFAFYHAPFPRTLHTFSSVMTPTNMPNSWQWLCGTICHGNVNTTLFFCFQLLGYQVRSSGKYRVSSTHSDVGLPPVTVNSGVSHDCSPWCPAVVIEDAFKTETKEKYELY